MHTEKPNHYSKMFKTEDYYPSYTEANIIKVYQKVSKKGFVELDWFPTMENIFEDSGGKLYDCTLVDNKGHTHYLKSSYDRVLVPCSGKLTYFYPMAYNDWNKEEYVLMGTIKQQKYENEKLTKELNTLKEKYCRQHVSTMNNFLGIIEKYKTFTDFVYNYTQDLDKIEDTNLHDFKVRLEFFDQEYLLEYIKNFYKELNQDKSKENLIENYRECKEE